MLKNFEGNKVFYISTSRLITLCFILLATLDVAHATDYYVSINGDDANNGMTENNAWRTITYAAAQAKAGDTVHIEGGDYGHEHVIITNSGTEKNPIIFKGYNGIPVIDGQDRNGIGIKLKGKKYITITNLKVNRYEVGIDLHDSHHIDFENIEANQFGDDPTHNRYKGIGIRLLYSHNTSFRNVTITDGRAANIEITYSNYNLFENCELYGTETDNPVDYYLLIIWSHDNIVRNCAAENKHPWSSVNTGHGFGIKDNPWMSGTHSYNNKFIDNVARGFGEHFFVSHGAHDNEFINCTAYRNGLFEKAWSIGLVSRDSAHNNIFKNCAVYDTQFGINTGDSKEAGEQIVHNNTFINTVIHNVTVAILYQNAEDNVIKNSIISKINKRLVNFEGNNSGNFIIDSIIIDVPSLSYGSGNVEFTNSKFWNNGFVTPSTNGNREIDPICDPLYAHLGMFEAEQPRYTNFFSQAKCRKMPFGWTLLAVTVIVFLIFVGKKKFKN